MKDKCKKEINDLIDALVNSYESKIEELSTPWYAIEAIESYLSLSGLSFQDLAGVMGYVVVQLDNAEADSETELETVKDSEQPVEAVAELTREEIVKLIQAINPEFTVSIKNTTKQQLIDEYNSLQKQDEVNSTNDIGEKE